MNHETLGRLNARLDRIPVATRSHKRWIALLVIFYYLDQFDIGVYSYTAPAMKAEWDLTLGQVALGASTPFIGMFLGAIVGGRLADMYGRRTIILYSVVLYSVLTGAIFFAPNIETVAILRGVSGIGLQALVGVVIVFISETFPKHLRGRYLAIMLMFALAGGPTAGFLARAVVPLSDGSWRFLYLCGLLGVISVAIAFFTFPESPRWLLTAGREEEAEAMVSRLENEARDATGAELPAPEYNPIVAAAAPAGSLKDLLRLPYSGRLVLCSLVMAALVLVLYGFNSWLPTLLTENGYSQSSAITLVTITSLFIPVGALIAYPVIDRIERKTVLLIASIIMAAALMAFVATDVWAFMAVSGCVVAAMMQTCMAAIFAYVPEVFPTALRGLGSGIINGIGRLSGFAGSFIIAAIFGAFGLESVFIYLTILTLFAGIALYLFGIKTTNRALEAIAADPDGIEPTASGGHTTEKLSTPADTV